MYIDGNGNRSRIISQDGVEGGRHYTCLFVFVQYKYKLIFFYYYSCLMYICKPYGYDRPYVHT